MYFGYRSRLSVQRMLLVSSDISVILCSIIASAIIRLSWIEGIDYLRQNVIHLVGASLVFLVVFYAGGMYDRQTVTRKTVTFKLTFVVTVISLLLIITLFYARFTMHIGRGILLLSGGFICISCWLSRCVFRMVLGYGVFSKNAMIVSDKAGAERIIKLLSKVGDAGYNILGIIQTDRGDEHSIIDGIAVMGDVENIKDYVAAYDIETIIVHSRMHDDRLLKLLRPIRYAGIEIYDYNGLMEKLAEEIPVDYIDDEWLMNAAMNSSRIHIKQMKRIMDITASSLGLLLLSPVFLLAVILVKTTSRGPVFYRQVRVGLDGRDYTLLKFRTMVENAEAGTGAVWATAGDARVTKVGFFFRQWRIDEIPQLINVLRGEMSLVGPRPERPEFVASLAEEVPFYRERLLVLPGITGWAQVKFPYATSVEGVKRKLQFDLFYIKNMSFFLDVVVLLRTFKTIVVGLRYGDGIEEDKDEKSFETQMTARFVEARSREREEA